MGKGDMEVKKLVARLIITGRYYYRSGTLSRFMRSRSSSSSRLGRSHLAGSGYPKTLFLLFQVFADSFSCHLQRL